MLTEIEPDHPQRRTLPKKSADVFAVDIVRIGEIYTKAVSPTINRDGGY